MRHERMGIVVVLSLWGLAGPGHAQFANDVWQLDLKSDTWTRLAAMPDPAAGSPAPRRHFAHAFDSSRGRMIVCAGDTAKTLELAALKNEPAHLKGISKQSIPPDGEVGAFEEFFERVEFTLEPRAAKPVCQITLFLLAEHDTDVAGSGGAWLGLYSVSLMLPEYVEAQGQGTCTSTDGTAPIGKDSQ